MEREDVLVEMVNMIQCYGGIMNRETTDAHNNLNHSDTAVSDFTRLYEEHVTYVFRYINYRVGNVATAEELTSAVFEKALAAFPRYKKEKAAPQTWLITIARNTVIDHLRKSAKTAIVQLEDAAGIESADPSPQEETEKREEVERLHFCFETLAYREQEIVSLKFGAELNNCRIASMLGLSKNNVGTILFRAISKLRNCVKDWMNGKG